MRCNMRVRAREVLAKHLIEAKADAPVVRLADAEVREAVAAEQE